MEVHCVVTLVGDLRKGLRERAAGPGRKPNLIGIHMHEPVSVKRVGEPLFAFQNRPPELRPKVGDGMKG